MISLRKQMAMRARDSRNLSICRLSSNSPATFVLYRLHELVHSVEVSLSVGTQGWRPR